MCDNVFFHTDIDSEWLIKNFKNPTSVNINHDYVKSKTTTFPYSDNFHFKKNHLILHMIMFYNI